MGLTISQVRSWTLGDLASTAAGLRTGAATMSEHAVSIINNLAGIDTIWQGESSDAGQVRSKDHADKMQEKSKRWNSAAAVLDKADEQMGLLRNAILDRADDPDNKQKYVIADDGNVELTDEYAKSLTDQDAKDRAEAARSTLETELRSLLATAEVSGQYYDWLTTNALLGEEKDPSSFYTPFFPEPTALPTASKAAANKDGSGPDQYNVDNPNWNGKLVLQRTKGLAELGAESLGPALPLATKFLQHYLDGSGKPMTVSVDDMLHDMPWFNAAAQAQTRATLDVALGAMPRGYTGPVGFQSDYSNRQPDGSYARPSNRANPDWTNTLGAFSYQTSGIAMPSAEGHYSVAARTSIYDYYNFETTDPSWLPQVSDLNMLHRAGWAQNFDTTGISSVQTSTYP